MNAEITGKSPHRRQPVPRAPNEAEELTVMTTAIIGTGGLGSVIARQLASGGGVEVERLIRTAGFEPVKADGIEQSGRLEVGGDLHGLVVGLAEARSLIGRA
jgi:predicted dinucleotide-binding enzyme